jgi:cell division topological specificity factor
MMGFWHRLFRRESGSSNVAKERLQLVLVHDRSGISPEVMKNLRDELIAVISKYVEIDAGTMEFELSQNRTQNTLTANIPLRPANRPPAPSTPQESPSSS